MHMLPDDELFLSDKIKHLLKADSSVSSTKVKIIDEISRKIESGEYFYGIEISNNLHEDLDYNSFKVAPSFTAVTWHGAANISAEPINNAPSLKVARLVRQSLPVLTHISCYKLTNEKLNSILQEDITNVLAIRGDLVDEEQPLKHASDLVKSIREIRGEDICIGVGGYPETHPESLSKEDDLKYLKEKVDCGADFIITQICFSATNILQFIEDCREIGIDKPIIPGIYVPSSYNELSAVCNITKVSPQNELLDEYSQRKDDYETFQEYAVDRSAEQVRTLFDSGANIFGVHFFTLSRFANVKKVIQKIF